MLLVLQLLHVLLQQQLLQQQQQLLLSTRIHRLAAVAQSVWVLSRCKSSGGYRCYSLTQG